MPLKPQRSVRRMRVSCQHQDRFVQYQYSLSLKVYLQFSHRCGPTGTLLKPSLYNEPDLIQRATTIIPGNGAIVEPRVLEHLNRKASPAHFCSLTLHRNGGRRLPHSRLLHAQKEGVYNGVRNARMGRRRTGRGALLRPFPRRVKLSRPKLFLVSRYLELELSSLRHPVNLKQTRAFERTRSHVLILRFPGGVRWGTPKGIKVTVKDRENMDTETC
ncbi:hypothetical protein H4582DRAFT_238205 [Lactarius indigo]|nr:hypothetical protein H4582DRAFT_238205 [Lactarius indigo]